MKGKVFHLEEESLNNNFFRKVLMTSPHSQLVVMSLKPGEDIGEEVHSLDQFIRVESGTGESVLDGEVTIIKDGDAVIIPEGVLHNIRNTGAVDLKLYTVYSPAQHADGTIHKTRDEAVEAEKLEHNA
jgi:mannose-6-phosphate isomerase-like protein (cupin superfamily)